MNWSLEDLLRETVERSGSDLHLTAAAPPTIRLYGRLQQLDEAVLESAEVEALARSVMAPTQWAYFETNRDLDMSHVIPGLGRFRVNVYRQRGSVALACRVIPETVPPLRELGLPPVVATLCRVARGLILVTGPTGHGKSTTLAAMIDLINTEQSHHIVTVEDPIEYVHMHKRSLVNQRELGHDTLTFPNALRAVLREDPDVIMVGEMRDLETIAMALTAAETGHLVFATLHTVNAAQSVDRIVDVFPPHQQQQIRVQLASVLEAVVSQQLIPSLQAAETSGVRKGLRGRVLAAEVMIATTAIRSLVREGKTHQMQHTIETGAQQGMQTLDRALADLVLRGVISLEEALVRAFYPEELRKLIGRVTV